jgi:DNA ligase-1
MLAHTYDSDKHDVDGYWWSVKKDGVRGCWDGNKMYSRNGNEFTIPKFLKEQLKKIKDREGNNMPLEGEIWFGIDTFTLCSGTTRRSLIDDAEWENMKFIIFDMPDEKCVFEERIDNIDKSIKNAGSLPNVELIEYKKFDKRLMTIDNLLKAAEDLGEEGLMLRKPGSMYVFKRSNDMLKVKSWNYKEAKVISYVEGTGRLKKMVGSLLVTTDEVSEDGKFITFRIGTGLSDVQRFSESESGDWKSKDIQKKINTCRKKMQSTIETSAEIKKERTNLVNIIRESNGKKKQNALSALNKLCLTMPLIGSIITFKYKELNKNGLPSFPVFVGIRDYE